MGIEYRGMLCVGYTYDHLSELEGFSEDDRDCYEFCEDKGLNYFSPYYDADSTTCIYGKEVIRSQGYSYTEIDKVDELISEAKDKMSKEFGIVPKAYLMAHGW